MNTPAKLAAYGAVLAVVLGGGAGAGAALGPIDVSSGDGHEAGDVAHGDEENGTADPATGDGRDGAGVTATDLPAGLSLARGGYRLDAGDVTFTGGTPAELRFRVLDESGEAVTTFEVEHEARLHLVVVGRNLVDYAHLHPRLADDGTWSVDLPTLPAGSYRAFADFRPTGAEALTLGLDLTMAGNAPATDVPAPSPTTRVDGYEVALEGELAPGESELGFTVSRDGAAVRTEPYLGAAGHLVAIRAGDLAYAHVHPLDGAGDAVRFAADFPTPGTYRLFLDFAHGGEVRTAAFTVEVPGTGAAGAPDPAPPASPTTGHDDGGH